MCVPGLRSRMQYRTHDPGGESPGRERGRDGPPPGAASETTRDETRETTTAPRAVLYLRDAPADSRLESTVLERLESLAETDRVAGVETRTWVARVPLSSSVPSRRSHVRAFEAMERWADERGLSIRPPFALGHVGSAVTDDVESVLVTPSVLLTLWDGDDIVAVYPHRDGNGTVTVTDALERLDGESRDGRAGGRDV